MFEVSEDEIIGERRRQGARGAIDHFALAVDSRDELEAVKQRLVDAGAEIGEIQRLGAEWSLFFRDIDGMELEVCAARRRLIGHTPAAAHTLHLPDLFVTVAFPTAVAVDPPTSCTCTATA